MGKNQHVTPHPDGGWQVKGEGNVRATVRTNTQKEAIDIQDKLKKINTSSGIIKYFKSLINIIIKSDTIESASNKSSPIPKL